ncbi:Crp/Fnr family transcriptional regulator [Reyranella sp.]|uniref:Crp/Fnr family transcriptional regulator n=1 Tax=Reyranella sp. TaxID=1929291 RepID=UPI003D105BA5
MAVETVAYRNVFLAVLPPCDLALLRPALQFVELSRGDILSEPGRRVSDVMFIEAGMVSVLTTMQDGSIFESATLGHESIVGVLSAIVDRPSSARTIAQIKGSGWKIPASDLRAAVDKSRTLQHLVLLSTELAIAQMQQIAACNALHAAEARLCRWILQARDRMDGDVIMLTQDFLAQMLAVRRPTVTLIAQKLQAAGLIRYRRGRITITDREGLEKLACECVGEIRNKTRRILGEIGS